MQHTLSPAKQTGEVRRLPEWVSSWGKCVAGSSLRKILLPSLWKIRFPRRKLMFNLAQRQLRSSLWGTEPANRSTCKESKWEKEALWCNGYRARAQPGWTKAAAGCLSGGPLLFPVYSSVCTLHFLKKTLLWNNQMGQCTSIQHTFCCLKSYDAVWQSNVQALASLASTGPLRWVTAENVVSPAF